MGEIKKSIIVVADTHFGLCEKYEDCDPNAFIDFLNWIKDLEDGKEKTLETGVWGSPHSERNLILEKPEKIILLGDILELWTASDEAVFASTIIITQSLSQLKCEKIYILGNHDHYLRYNKGKYPLGVSNTRVIENDEYWISKGEEDYCFFHGHQFDSGFKNPIWKVIGFLQKPAFLFGNWAWIISALFGISLILVLLGIGGIANIVLTLLLGILSGPFLVMKFAKDFWYGRRNIKFDPFAAREGAADRLDQIWSNFEDMLAPDNPPLNVVYGHTHTIDYLTETLGVTDGEEFPVMNILNLPSWVRMRTPNLFPLKEDRALARAKEESIENEISHVFLYITEDQGPLFIGWDIIDKKPYLIPEDIIFEKRTHGNLSNFELKDDGVIINKDNLGDELKKIGWPEKLITKWINGFSTDLALGDKKNNMQ